MRVLLPRSYKPIRGSGCRYLGRITPGRCYLRTYTYLLQQHEALLQLARATWNTTKGVEAPNVHLAPGGNIKGPAPSAEPVVAFRKASPW